MTKKKTIVKEVTKSNVKETLALAAFQEIIEFLDPVKETIFRMGGPEQLRKGFIPIARSEIFAMLHDVCAVIQDYQDDCLEYDEENHMQKVMVDNDVPIEDDTPNKVSTADFNSFDKAFVLQQAKVEYLRKNKMTDEEFLEKNSAEQLKMRGEISKIAQQIVGEYAKVRQTTLANSSFNFVESKDVDQTDEFRKAFFSEKIDSLTKELRLVQNQIDEIEQNKAQTKGNVVLMYEEQLELLLKQKIKLENDIEYYEGLLEQVLQEALQT